MNTLVVAPVLVPLATLVLGVWVRARPGWSAALSVLGAVALTAVGVRLVTLAAGGTVLVAQMGGWPAPFGITLAVDRLSAAMVAVTGIIGLATVLQGLGRGGDFHLLVHGLLAGVSGAFVTADVFNLYVWFEVLLMASFALMALGGGRRRLAGALNYMVLNLLAAFVFLLAAGLLYGTTGTLNLAELALLFRQGQAPGSATVAVALLLFGFAAKAALFPVFGWLPASYHVPWPAVSALFAGLLTKVGVYALIRVVTLLWPEPGPVHQVLLWIACATMLVGVLGAAAQNEVRRVLSFHIVSQVGYMVLGLAVGTPLAIAGAVFYVIHHILVKANLFFVGGLAARMAGSERLPAMGGLYERAPALALLFAVPALSLAGMPPLSGFWAKLFLVKATLDQGLWWAAAAALLTGLFTLLSMAKIWNEAFLKPQPGEGVEFGSPPSPPGGSAAGTGASAPAESRPLGALPVWGPMAALALLTLLIGLGAGPVLDYAAAAAQQLAEPWAYFQAVVPGAGR